MPVVLRFVYEQIDLIFEILKQEMKWNTDTFVEVYLRLKASSEVEH